MSITGTVEYFSHLGKQDRVVFLLSVAFELTIGARGYYRGQEPSGAACVKLAAFNEIQHQVASMARHVLARSAARYPDDVFFEILLEKASAGGCEAELLASLENARSAAQRPQPSR